MDECQNKRVQKEQEGEEIMKITKEEKSLYRFLNVINMIFGRTTNRTYLIGFGRELYFYTLGYCGAFISKYDSQKIIDNYDFGRQEYQLKQLPSKEYVLDTYKHDDAYTANIINFIVNRCDDGVWQMEMNKDYPCKASKIAVHTNKWMKDNDLALLKSFDSHDVYTCGDGILFSFRDEACNISLIFMDSVVAPDSDDVTQLRLEEIETSLVQTLGYYSENAEKSSQSKKVYTGK